MTNQDKLQEEVISKTLDFYKSNNKGYLDLAMRTGKCRITIEMLKRKYKHDCFVLIAYPDNKLRDTWLSEFELWKYDNPRVTLVNFSSLKKYEYDKFDFFVIDEFHSLSQNEAIIANSIIENSIYSLGLSGTVSNETKQKWPKFKEIYKYTTLQAIDSGVVSDYTLTVHLVNLDNKTKVPNKKGKLVTEKQKYDALSYVIAKTRAQGKDTMFLALSRNRLSLSSIGKLEYLRKLLKKLEGKRVLVFTGLAEVADNIGGTIASYHSKSKSDANFIAFQNEKINHLALAAMGKVGVTYKNLDSVILLNFTYNKEESAQILNRAIKLDYSGKVADLHIVCLREEPEMKKIKESLSMLDASKIKYI